MIDISRYEYSLSLMSVEGALLRVALAAVHALVRVHARVRSLMHLHGGLAREQLVAYAEEQTYHCYLPFLTRGMFFATIHFVGCNKGVCRTSGEPVYY